MENLVNVPLAKEEIFLMAAKEYEALQDKVTEVREKLTKAMLDLGMDQYVQDPVTSVVYKIMKPTGTFMYYKDIDYKRTALPGEKGGVVLSKKEAQEVGFTL